MTISRATVKGQVIIPAPLGKKFNIKKAGVRHNRGGRECDFDKTASRRSDRSVTRNPEGQNIDDPGSHQGAARGIESWIKHTFLIAMH